MKLELNYDCKTITVKDQINLKEFIKEVKKLGLDLKKWNVVSDVVWSSYPIITYPQPYITYYGTITNDCDNLFISSDCKTTTIN